MPLFDLVVLCTDDRGENHIELITVTATDARAAEHDTPFKSSGNLIDVLDVIERVDPADECPVCYRRYCEVC